VRRLSRRRVVRAKPRLVWARGVFDQNILESGSVFASEFVLFDPASNNPEVETQGNMTTLVRRVICRGGITYFPENSPTPLVVNTALHMCVYVIDREDADNGILAGGSSTVLGSMRVLWQNCVPFLFSQTDYTNDAPSFFDHTIPVVLDARLNVKLRPDDLIVIGFQHAVDVSGVQEQEPQLSMTVSVLWQAP